MALGPNTSWQIDGETMETVTDFIFSGSKITADCDCSHEIKRCLLLGGKAVTNLDRYYFANKYLSSQSHGFPSSHVWNESCAIKKLSTKKLMLLNCGIGEDF